MIDCYYIHYDNEGGTTVKRNTLCKLKFLAFALIVSASIIPQVSYAKEKPALTKTEVAIGKKNSVDINIKNKVKGSKYQWTSSDEEVATVNEKGVIKGKKGGDAVITCTVTTPEGKVYKLSCDVSINTKTKVTVFNQKDLEKALADKDVQVVTNANLRKVDVTAVKNIETKKYEKNSEPSPAEEKQGEEKELNNEKQQNEEKQGNTGNAAGGLPVIVGPVFPGNTGGNTGTEPMPVPGGNSGSKENPGANPEETPVPGTEVKPEESQTPGTDVNPGENPTPETDVNPGEKPTSETEPKPEETPSSGSDTETEEEDSQLKKAKEDAIAAIYEEAEKYRHKLNKKELNEFNNMLQYYINYINMALTVGGVEDFKNAAIENIRSFKLEDDEDAFEKTRDKENADYQAFLNGTMSLQELYDKYAHGDNGYEYSYVDGGPFMLDFDRMETFLYVIPEENRVDFFDDNSDGKYNYRPDFEEKRTILHNRYGEEVETYYIGSVNGMIVSYNNTTRTICVKDLVNCETHFIQTMDSPATEWEEDGKIYYGYPSNPESLNVIYTKDGMAEINLKTFSDSSITFMVYMNNVESINRICHHKSAKELDTSYYSVVYHENNMADVIFNQLFIDTFIKTVTEDTLLQFVMFPSEDTSNGVGLNFEITAE